MLAESLVNMLTKTLVYILAKSLVNILVKSQAYDEEFFGAGEVSCNKGTSMNVSYMSHKKRICRENILVFFSKILLKQHFK